MNERPSYYSITPAEVRYANITNGAKMLYWEITALANKEWFCWANNEYFAQLYWVSSITISRWITSLKENWFVRIIFENNDFSKRKIYIWEITEVLTKIAKPFIKNDKSFNQNCKEPLTKMLKAFNKNVKHNNKYNTTSNNILSKDNIYKENLKKFNILKSFKSLEFEKYTDVNWNKLFENKEFCKSILDYEEMRKTIKRPLTQRAVELQLIKASKYDVFYFTKMLEQSILHSWQDTYEIKEQPNDNEKIIDDMQQKALQEAEERKKRYSNLNINTWVWT